ncbi:NADH-ubiquinone oxidoreductase-F iron-sulfur binding region domain-containing protein [Paractinoplanes durhamensis]|uniref:NADH dehydrogenase n=1 Tax=Paractinoplanes durhamensis TaxID=113563 RepID=A0ABQ3ZD72_9ACTN|nr:NADH-ubiquinone oxidoreductase-F iron-sulfur binding region domain-containing protein [Actinoplanes durhamensis]GIE07766.1 NADH dehydrogenase [Actinoplanes durhamensis]
MSAATRLADEAPPRPIPLLDGAIRYRAADRRLLSGPQPDGLAEHLARYGARPRRSGRSLITAMDAIQLTGRGGARFPAAAKWRTALAAGGRGYVVANGAEGEPASAKDAALLQHRPHLVLDGLATAAETMDATGAVVWLHETAHATRHAIGRALAERRAAGLIEPPVHVLAGPDHYLTGESSAVISGLAGGPVLPAFQRVPAARAGLYGRPTLVQNVETLARVALLARTGPVAPQPGPMVTVAAGGLLTVLEPPPNATVARILQVSGVLGGPSAQPPQAVLLGGYGGGWATWTAIGGCPIGHLDGHGPVPADTPSLGAGIIVPLPRDACGVAETASALDYLARSSAGQCGPCVFGTRELADTMTRLATGRSRRHDGDRIRRLTGEIDGRGACGLPDGATRIASTALHVFAADVHEHLRRDRCLHPGSQAVLPVPEIR